MRVRNSLVRRVLFLESVGLDALANVECCLIKAPFFRLPTRHAAVYDYVRHAQHAHVCTRSAAIAQLGSLAIIALNIIAFYAGIPAVRPQRFQKAALALHSWT